MIIWWSVHHWWHCLRLYVLFAMWNVVRHRFFPAIKNHGSQLDWVMQPTVDCIVLRTPTVRFATRAGWYKTITMLSQVNKCWDRENAWKKHCIPDLKCQGLLRGVVRVMKSIPAFEDLDVANTMTLHALRFICTSEWKLCFAQRNLRSFLVLT